MDTLFVAVNEDIEVEYLGNEPIEVQLYGVGLPGRDGVVTPELEALRLEVIGFKDNAKTSETNAKASETAANSSKTAAATSATNAKTSETNAKTSETNAATSRTNAATSATNAKTSETNSKASETSALASMNAAADSATAANASAVAAKTSETNSKSSETKAKTSETNAKTSETNASAANTAAQAAKTSVDTSKTAVEASQTDALASKNAAAASAATAVTNKDQAVAAKTAAETASGIAVAARDAAEVHADNAAASAALAATFDPTIYPRRDNNGSDFTNPALVRANIGAQATLITATQAEAEAGTSTTARGWTPQRVKQAHADKAPLASPSLTGTPLAPTAPEGTNTKQIATTEFVRQAIAAIVGSSPESMDTLKELADALGNDPNFATTITNLIAGKANAVHTHTAAEITDLAAILADKLALIDADKRYAKKPLLVEPTIDLLLTSPDAILAEWFTRASRGTYFDTLGNMRVAEINKPRFDFDPLTGEPLGILLEAPSTNLLVWSTDMLVAPWNNTRLNRELGPVVKGVQLFKLTPDTTEGQSHQISNNFSTVALAEDTPFTVSFIVGHIGEQTKRCAIRSFDSIGFLSYTYFDLDEVRVTSVGTETIAEITDIGGGLRKIKLTRTLRTGSTSTGFQFYAADPNATAVTSYNFNGTDCYLVGACQMEQAAFASSYIPTEASTVTRDTDSLVIPLTASVFSDRPMTIYSEAKTYRPASAYLATNDRAGIWCLKGTAAGLFSFYSTKMVLMSRTDAAVFPNFNMADQPNPIAYQKSVVSFDAQGVCRSSVEGAAIVAASTLQFPISNMNRLIIGDEGVGANGIRSLKGHIRRLTVYPSFLSDDDLRSLTR